MVDRMGEKRGWDELGVPHGAGPGTLERTALETGFREDVKGREELSLREVGPPSAERYGRERFDDIEGTELRAETGLHTPDRDQDFCGDAVLSLKIPQQRAVLLHLPPSIRDAPVGDCTLEVFPYRPDEFRLERLQFQDPFIEREVRERPRREVGLDSPCDGGCPEGLQPGLEFRHVDHPLAAWLRGVGDDLGVQRRGHPLAHPESACENQRDCD